MPNMLSSWNKLIIIIIYLEIFLNTYIIIIIIILHSLWSEKLVPSPQGRSKLGNRVFCTFNGTDKKGIWW